MPSGRSSVSLVLTAAGLVAAGGLCSCAGKGTASTTPDERQAVALKTKDKDNDDLRKYIDKFDPLTDTENGEPHAVIDPPKGTDSGSYAELQKAIDTSPPPPTAGGGTSRQGPKSPSDSEGATPASPDALAPLGPPLPEPNAEAPESLQERMGRQVGELRQTMHELRASGDKTSAEAIELLALRMLDSGGAGPELDAVKQKLSAGQLRALSALESLLAEVRADDSGGAALDARRLAKLLVDQADKLADSRPVRITASALCTSVQSYGCYTKFPDNTFLQGRMQPMIVYVALENFTQRAASAARADDAPTGLTVNPPSAKEREKKEAAAKRDRKAHPAREEAAPTGEVVVELMETITIHNDADDLIVWKAPEASVRDVSRDRRKDYYLVQRVELPSRLTLGKYNLKVSVRDVATGATDEALIPIEIVADPALASVRR